MGMKQESLRKSNELFTTENIEHIKLNMYTELLDNSLQ